MPLPDLDRVLDFTPLINELRWHVDNVPDGRGRVFREIYAQVLCIELQFHFFGAVLNKEKCC